VTAGTSKWTGTFTFMEKSNITPGSGSQGQEVTLVIEEPGTNWWTSPAIRVSLLHRTLQRTKLMAKGENL
jgi:hypothetical protein